MKKQDNRDQKPGGGNFFNQNPILIFAIFSIIAILIFKNFAEDTSVNGGMENGQNVRKVTKNLSYYDFKELVKQGQIDYVAIGKTQIKATSDQGNLRTIYLIKRIEPDEGLLPLLEEKKVRYSGLRELAFGSAFWMGVADLYLLRNLDAADIKNAEKHGRRRAGYREQ